MLQLQSIFTATIGVLLVATVPAAAQWNSLDSLPVATQDEIGRVCLPVQFREGAGAYRNCVQSEIDLRASDRATDLGQLSFDDKYAVQQACAKAGGQSSADYFSCVSAQIDELNQIAAPSLSQLSEDELYVVQQSCFNAQSKQGAASYRQCLNNEVLSLISIPAADTSNLNMLKKNALQLRCSSNSTNVVQYRQCIADQYEPIAGTEPEFLPTNATAGVTSQAAASTSSAVAASTVSDASEQDLNPLPTAAQILEQPQTTDVASLNNELGNELGNEQGNELGDKLSSEPSTGKPITTLPRNITPPPSTDGLSAPTTAALDIDQTATPDTQTIEASVSNELPSANPLPETVNNAADTSTYTNTNTQSSSQTAESRVISRPELVETLELQEQANAQANAQGIELEPAVDPDTSANVAASSQNVPPMQKVNELWQTVLTKLSSMDAIGWLLIAGVLALPAILLGIFSMLRGLRKSTPKMPEYAAAHNNPVESGLNSRRLRHEQDAASLFDDDMESDHDAVTRMATKSEQRLASQRPQASGDPKSGSYANTYGSSDEPAWDGDESPRQSAENDSNWQSAFGDWLLEQPEANRMGACIEFLVYWIAYGDDRYQPDLKQRLFTDTNLTSHDQIKRWVLKQDVFAFSDVIGWLRTNATQKQLDQCIALLMALLVTEHSITPVQNTLLRFLSDAFNIGKNQLEQRFDKAFGHPMPPVPRTDKTAWWAKQKPEFMQRWEARIMATRTENEQMIARLGLTADYDDALTINAFRRAARRCHPDRFTELGDRERALAEQQFIKFEQARDKLLGVSV